MRRTIRQLGDIAIAPDDLGQSGSDPASVPSTGRAFALVSVSSSRCLRSSKTPCTRCAGSCAVGAVNLAAETVSISDACLACGSCAAACPTGAIVAAGFEAPSAYGRRLRIECSRIPPEQLDRDSWIVPCIAGLRIADIVHAADASAAGEAVTIDLIDRGLCRNCSASGGCNKTEEVRSALCSAIDSVTPELISVRRVGAPLDPAQARPVGARPARSRRSFLRPLIEPRQRRSACHGIIEDRTALAHLAARAGRRLDARHFPVIAISDACRDHTVCAASCPTGALRRESAGHSDEIRRLVFDPTACVACGRCAQACPEAALTFAPAGAGPLADAPIVLRRQTLPICPTCEDAFIPNSDGGALCPACRKGNALFAEFVHGRQSDDAPHVSSTGGML